MSTPDTVYTIDYDVSKALENLRKLEKLLVSVDTKGRELFKNMTVSKSLKQVTAAADRAGKSTVAASTAAKKSATDATAATKQLSAGIGEVGKSTQKTSKDTTAFAKSLDKFAKKVNKLNKKAADTAQKDSARRAKSLTRDIAKQGSALDRILSQSKRKTAKGFREIEKASERARKEFGRTDKALAKAMKPKGERRKAKDIRAIATSGALASQSITRLAAKLSLMIGAVSGIRAVKDDYLAFDQAATSAAAKFSRVEPTLRPGTEGFKNFSREIREAGLGTEHSADAVARAVDFWAKAGKSSTQTKAVLNSTLDFASANQDSSGAMLDVARAGDILSDTLGQFKLNADDSNVLMANTARVSDVMSAAANRANMSAEELFEAFTSAGPTLSAVGSDIEETSSFLATMANAGIKGAAAGTQLKMSIANLSAMTGPQEAMFAKMGVTIKDSQGNFRGLTTIIRDLNEATKDMGSADRFQVFAKAVGRRAIPSFINLISEGQVNLDNMTTALRGATGETTRLSDEMRSSATAKLAKFENRMKDIGFRIIDQTNLFGRLTDALDGVDWDTVIQTVTDELIPAFLQVGRVVSDTIIPAFRRAYLIVSTALSPVIKVLSVLFKNLTGEGDTLANMLGDPIALWVAYRGYLMAVKATGMISWVVDLTRTLVSAGTAQAGLNTATAATNATMATSIKSFGLLKSGAALFAAAIAGWEVGTLIHAKVVEPLAKANAELSRLKAEIEDSKKQDLAEKSLGNLEADKRTAEKALKIESENQERLSSVMLATGMGGFGAMGAGAMGPERTSAAANRGTEEFLMDVEEQIMLKRPIQKQQQNIKKYATPEAQVSEVPDLFDIAGQTIDPSIVENIKLAVAAGEALGEGQSFTDDLFGGVDQSLDLGIATLVDLAKEDAKKKEQWETARFEREKAMTAQAKTEQKQVVQNVTVGPTSIKVEANGANVEDMERVARRALADAGREVKRNVMDGMRSEGPSEI